MDAKANAVYKAKIELTAKDSNVKIASIKHAKDFANNKFTIIESINSCLLKTFSFSCL
ncbi:hypothetical protein SDC9_212607 [bioreactor metagenome]|uniref:Uncharacterized protein n=1 Tax=bioreactor metagenome TaxID=1076179 RepID=A0A645JP29_9ZZZZ